MPLKPRVAVIEEQERKVQTEVATLKKAHGSVMRDKGRIVGTGKGRISP